MSYPDGLIWLSLSSWELHSTVRASLCDVAHTVREERLKDGACILPHRSRAGKWVKPLPSKAAVQGVLTEFISALKWWRDCKTPLSTKSVSFPSSFRDSTDDNTICCRLSDKTVIWYLSCNLFIKTGKQYESPIRRSTVMLQVNANDRPKLCFTVNILAIKSLPLHTMRLNNIYFKSSIKQFKILMGSKWNLHYSLSRGVLWNNRNENNIETLQTVDFS